MNEPLKMPVADFGVKTMVPTLNGTGFMFKVRDSFAEEWSSYAGTIGDPVLEVGCAYGVSVIPALEAGATVTACDMEQQHLDILADRVTDPAQKARLTCKAGTLPDIDFAPSSFGAILCSRVLHFLSGEDIDASVANMARWLKPGGRLYLVADTPYGIWRNFIPHFVANREQGARWPGMMIGLHNWLPTPGIQKHIDKPPFMNLLDAELLARACREVGLTVERNAFIPRPDFKGMGYLDGRENAGVMALKPLA